jgi:hypothetical protein
MFGTLTPSTSLVLLLLTSVSAGAQPRPSGPTPSGDGDPLTRQAAERALPLRLSLLDPNGLAGVPTSFECVEGAEGIRQSHTQIELQSAVLRLTPRFTLHAFSRWGCTPTVAVAGGFTYAVKLSPRLTGVLSAGLAGNPHGDYPLFGAGRAGNSWVLRPVLRADVQWQARDGSPRSIGIDGWRLIRSAVKSSVKGRVSASISGAF